MTVQSLTAPQRRNFEQAILRALKARYAGRPVRVEWDADVPGP